MKYTIIFLLMLAVSALVADSLSCYKESMVSAILRIDKRGYVFENYAKWGEEGNDRDLLNKNFSWAYRDGNQSILNDAEFLDRLGQEAAAEKMRELYHDRKSKGNLRMFIGVPLGIAMSVAGVLWFDHNMDIEEPSTLDQAGSVVLGITGVGVSIGSIISFITTRSVDPYDHEITRRQTLEMIDRHNNALASRCKAENAKPIDREKAAEPAVIEPKNPSEGEVEGE